MGKAKSNNKASKAEPAKKCTCDHPFKCDCGNRPERPSKGHKWDPSTQQWGGKGHKQKGATLQAASTGQADKVTNVGGVAIKQWQKLPSDLLKELCKKHGMGIPVYRRLDKAKNSSEYRFKLIVPSGKKTTSDHDVVLSPSLAVPNEEQAKEEAALLGLLYVFPKLPHERTLPEPYRSTFLEALKNSQGGAGAGGADDGSKSTTKKKKAEANMDVTKDGNTESKSDATRPTAKANTQLTANLPSFQNKSRSNKSSQPSASVPLLTKAQIKEAKLQRERDFQARIRKHEAIRNANKPMEVFMCASMRKRIERLLAGDSVDDIMDEEEDDEFVDGEEEDVIQSYVIQRLVHEGFTTSQVRKGYRAVSGKLVTSNSSNSDQLMDKAYEETLQYLCIHLNEDQLPIGFDPRGGTLDVVRPAAKTKYATTNAGNINNTSAADDEDENYDKSVIQFARQFGLTRKEAFAVLSYELPSEVKPNSTISTSEMLMQRWRFWNVLCTKQSIERSCFVDIGKLDLSQDCRERNMEAATNELEALAAIFDEQGFSTTKIGADTTSVSIGLSVGDMKLILEVIYSNGNYPDFMPMAFITTDGSAHFHQGCHLHVNMIKFLSTLGGNEAIFELYGHVQELLQDIDIQSNPVNDTSMLLSQLNIDCEETIKTTDKERDATNTSKDIETKPPIPHQQIISTRRPREKSSFWNTSPKNAPPADAFPKLSVLLEKARKSLPAAKAKSEFLSLLEKASHGGRVVLVTGETGCGKTTQIPQFILENDPTGAKIVVAQPRRLAATGVATRVAIERGEPRPGVGSVGYSVRGDSKNCASTRLIFCTTGVLLRQLQSQGALENISHIIIDEVHERHLDSDVLLAILKRFLPDYPHLNVVLMSATMDADRFAAYWGKNTPRMHIPGFTHPVKDFTLEDVIKMTGYLPPKKKGRNGGNYQIQDTLEEIDGLDPSDLDINPAQASTVQISTEERIKRMDPNDIDYDLLSVLINCVLQNKVDDGSILVFLPGVGEIERAERALNQRNIPSIQILPLHGGLQQEKQQQVFVPARNGFTKIILSTNVAETSITIPDCTIVVDSCKEKQSSFDPINRMPLLLERFASQDSLRQRRGRAGRLRPGVCYKLISKQHHSTLPAHGTPEIKRCALEQTILSLLFLGLEDGSAEFLSSMIDPPSKESIHSAFVCLEKLGAVEKEGGISPLGRHLAGIPAPPAVAKLLVMGSLLGCRSISLAIAAGMSVGRSPFIRLGSPSFQARRDNDTGKEKQGDNGQILEARKTLFKSVGNSEHCMLGRAYLTWDESYGNEKKKCCGKIEKAYFLQRVSPMFLFHLS